MTKLYRSIGALVLIFVLPAVIFGQGLTAVTGRVTDPTGAVIPGVDVTITNMATGATRTVITNEQGIYTATQLAPGTYSIKAELAGFRAKIASDVALPVEQIITVNLALEVGAVTDIVEVLASAEIVNTENAQLGSGFDSTKILNLPLNARNIVGLLSLQTGVSMDTGSETTSGFVNGARNDQQNIVLDGVDINRQLEGSAFRGALPTTLDSVQEFIVQTSGQSAAAARSSGAQVQLVTKSGSNEFHGSLYESYRSKVTTATPYFSKDYACTKEKPCKPGLIRNIPGGSIGGPIIRNRLFFFGAYERRTDRSQSTVSRTIPTETLLSGVVRYQRTAAAAARDGQAFGVITGGCGGMLERITQIPCDTFNPAAIGPNGLYERYRKYLTDPSGTVTCPADCSNFQTFRFNAPNISDQNIYIARFDLTLNSKNTVYVRGTLNNQADLGPPTFPDINNALTDYDNSKGFAASLNSVISPTMNNTFTAGLTRESVSETGSAAVNWDLGPTSFFQTQGANWRAINTWNFVDNLSIIKGTHTWQMGGNFSFMTNNFKSYGTAAPGTFNNAVNEMAGDTTGNTLVARAVDAAEFASVANKQSFLSAIADTTGTFNRLNNVGIQFDKNGNLLPVGTPFERSMRVDQFALYIQDNWKIRPNMTLNYGLNWGIMTPPWEKNGVQVNWVQSLKDRYNTIRKSPKIYDDLPRLSMELAGRGNGLPDYYSPALNNFAPRASFAYTPQWQNGILGALATKGGDMVIRGGYSLSFDQTGRGLGTDAAASGGIGLLTSYASPIQIFSFDGVGVPRAPRVSGTGDNIVLPFNAFPISLQQSFTPVDSAGGWGGPRGLPSIDSTLRPPTNHLVNFTISKELPGGIVVEASYVGRFARGLVGILDLANPINVVDPQSGMDYYTAVKTLFEQYEYPGAGSQFGNITTANAVQAVAGIQPIPWFENVYSDYKDWAALPTNGSFGFPNAQFANATQAFYAVLNKGKTPGPNTPVVLTDAINNFEVGIRKHILSNGQAQYQGFYSNVGWSNYNSGQFSVRKRFSQGFTAAANYTWSHSLDITSASESFGNRPGGSGSADQLIDPYNPERNYGNSTFDRRHQFNGNFVLELPFGSGKPIGGGASGILNHIIGGWSLSGIVTAASGSPFHFGAGNRFTLHFNGGDIAVPTEKLEYKINKGHNAAVITNGVVTGGGTPTVFFIRDEDLAPGCRSDATCPESQVNRLAATKKFVTPYPGGPIARNYVYGPGMFNVDAGLTKSFRITEGFNGVLRAEAFNVLNHVNFNNPNQRNIDSTSGTLGQITTARDMRVMQFTIRLQF